MSERSSNEAKYRTMTTSATCKFI